MQPNTLSLTAAEFDGVAQTLTLSATRYDPDPPEAQGVAVGAQQQLDLFDTNNKLAVSVPPYVSSTPPAANFTSTTAVRLTYEASSETLEVSDPAALRLLEPAVRGYRNYGTGTGAFDAVHCPTGFGTNGTSDASLMTSTRAVQRPRRGPRIKSPVTPTVTSRYGTTGALNRFAPGSRPPTSLAAALPYAHPFGLSTDGARNVTSPLASSVPLSIAPGTTPLTPSNIAVIP
jgi:hypothetical protein